MKISIIAAISLDGYLSHRENESSGWTSKEDKRFFKTMTLGKNNTIIIGRKTYETIPAGLPGRYLYVLTKTIDARESKEGVIFYNGEVESLLARLQEQGVLECWVAGGREIYSLFMRKKLVDELYLTLEPILFGKGVPFFNDFGGDIHLELKDHYLVNQHAIGLHYLVSAKRRE